MSDYRRFFSYIYSYENGQKISNAGFAKIEIKNSVTSIELHMRNAYLSTPAACLYLFVRDNDSILGFALGDVPLSNGTADRRYTLTGAQLNDSPFHITDAAGILLTSDDNICFASQWDEQPIDWDRFHIYEPPHVEEETHEKVISSTELSDSSSEAELYLFPEQKTSYFENTEDLSHLQSYEDPEDDSVILIHKKNRSATDRNHDSSIQLWKNLFDTYPHTHPFADTNIVCVRIELKDLRLLPPQNWHLCNNGFLLHAFFTYHYLLLGKIATPRSEEWFIAVPGIGYRQQHVLAAIFGFSNFLPDKDNPDTQEPFGYWYTTMDESD